MARARKNNPAGFGAVRVEGGLIAPAKLDEIASLGAGDQSAADYEIPRGLQVKDEIARYFRIGQALHKDFSTAAEPSLASTTRFIEALFKQTFGFDDIVAGGERVIDERSFPIALEARGGRAPIVATIPAETLDQASTQLSAEGRRRSAATVMQDWLNANDGALWGVACNGVTLRLMRDNASLTRPAYIEADLKQMFEAEDFASFSILWLLIHATRFGNGDASVADCPLERWREAGAKAGVAARDRLRDGVERALVTLGTGFLANTTIRERLEKGELSLDTYFAELLRLVYRLIFLFAAEDRDVLHAPGADETSKRLYAQGYSVGRLRERAVRRNAWDRHGDQWEGMKIVFLALARGEKRLALPALGGIFLPNQTPTLDGAKLSNKALLEAVFRLAWLKDGATLVPVNWRDMETEELGSVYESLLELTPRLLEGARAFGFAEGAETRGNARKTTGSYYTPDSLVQALLDTALDPVLDRVEAEADDPANALLGVTVIDPACGSGHFLLAAARRIATRVARARAGGVASAADYRHALRDVARACIYGVDRNPMAVELSKVALWIETIEPGKPLGFLDANIRIGDALFGIYNLEALRKGIPDAAYKALTGDDKEAAKHFAKLNKAERDGQGALDFAGGAGALPPAPPLAKSAHAVRELPEDTVEEIAAKRAKWDQVQRDPRLRNWQLAADLYCAAFLTPKTGGPPAERATAMIPLTGDVWAKLSGKQVWGEMEAAAVDRAGGARAFHWPLQFPDVLGNGRGGFDVVLGNPPWERIKLQEQEFFAARDQEIARAPNAAARRRLIRALSEAPEGSPERRLHVAFELAKREAEAASEFARIDGEVGGRFPLAGRGDVNTYALFAELFATAVSERGRAGVIVPTGIATDATTQFFFGNLVARNRLASIFSFFEIRKVFPATDDRNSFCMLTIGEPDGQGAEFAFQLLEIADLAESERRFRLTAADIARINPNTKTAPIFRSRRDADLVAKIYGGSPVLVEEGQGAAGNAWGLTFARMFDMANDSHLFRTAAQLRAAGFERDGSDWVPTGVRPRQGALELEGGRVPGDLVLQGGGQAKARYVPLYQAKMIHHFDHRWATFSDPQGAAVPEASDVTVDQKVDATFEVAPRYWVSTAEVEARLGDERGRNGWLMGWRDMCRATDVRTVITAAFPRVAANHKTPLFFIEHGPRHGAAFLACLASLTLDYIARLKLGGTSLTFFVVKQLAFPRPSAFALRDLDFIVPRVLELSFTSHSMTPFARDLGYDGAPFRWDEDRRAVLRAELDARIARLYGLTRDELRYILDPADVLGPTYPSETFRVLKENEIRKHGEYRTAKLVLQAWDREEEELRGERN